MTLGPKNRLHSVHSSRLAAHMILTGLLLTLVPAPLGRCAAEGAGSRRATYLQVVNKADPKLEWTLPNPIPFGEPLSATQLSATARTPGDFAYKPGPGAILQPGTQLLNVAFTPANVNFLSAAASVPLTITPPGNSTFQIQPLSGGNQILVYGNEAATVPMNVMPIGDFHQPVTLSCTHPDNITCTISPDMVRPTTTPAQVVLAVRRMPQPGSRAGATLPRSMPGSRRLPFVPFVAACLLGGFSLHMRRLRLQRNLPRLGSVALAAILTCSSSGCGGGWAKPEQITVVAKSLVESRSLPVAIYLEP